jgi:hypothetical protein
LNAGLHTCKAGPLSLEAHIQGIFALVILEMGGLKNYLRVCISKNIVHVGFNSTFNSASVGVVVGAFLLP